MAKNNLKTKQNRILSIILWGLIGLLVFFIIMVSYMPKLSNKVIGVSSYQVLTGYDSTLQKHEMLIVKDKNFEDLESGDIIVFKLTGYGDADGLKAYSVLSQPDPSYYHVRSTDNWMSFPWNITEDMYIGVVTSKIPYLGAVMGFLGSFYGIAVLIFNGFIICGIIYVIKGKKKEEVV